MNSDTKMAIIMNDLDSMIQRIEDLPAHPKLTQALGAVQEAKTSVGIARADIHQADMKERFAQADRG